MLLKADLVRRERRRYVVHDSQTVDAAGGRHALHRLKQHWNGVATGRIQTPRRNDFLAYNVMSLSERDLLAVREKLRTTFHEIRAMVAASKPEQTVAVLNLQFITFGCDDIDKSAEAVLPS
jgi:hypothetical protein